jgi:ribosomal protein S7
MSRRHRAEKRHVVPDIRYNSPLVAHLVNVIMKSGKKNLARSWRRATRLTSSSARSRTPAPGSR